MVTPKAWGFPITPHLHLVGSGVYGVSHRLDCNTYLLHSEESAVLIDAGAGLAPEEIVANVRAAGVARVERILLTHAHADHAGGALALRTRYGARVAASAADAALIESGDDQALGLAQAKRSGSYPPDYRFTHCPVDDRLTEEVTLQVGAITIRPVVVPSHTAGSVVYLAETPEGRWAFTGDVVLVGGMISLINVPGCDLAGYREHFHKLLGLGVDGLFPGHWMWRVRDGQADLDQVWEQLQRSRIPRNFAALL